jgi:hypothetical protein
MKHKEVTPLRNLENGVWELVYEQEHSTMQGRLAGNSIKQYKNRNNGFMITTEANRYGSTFDAPNTPYVCVNDNKLNTLHESRPKTIKQLEMTTKKMMDKYARGKIVTRDEMIAKGMDYDTKGIIVQPILNWRIVESDVMTTRYENTNGCVIEAHYNSSEWAEPFEITEDNPAGDGYFSLDIYRPGKRRLHRDYDNLALFNDALAKYMSKYN